MKAASYMSNYSVVCTCKPGAERNAAEELQKSGCTPIVLSPGIVASTDSPHEAVSNLCFTHHILYAPSAILADCALEKSARSLVNEYGQRIASQKISEPWPFAFLAWPPAQTRLSLVSHLQKAWADNLRRAMPRVAKLSCGRSCSDPGKFSGFLVVATENRMLYVSDKWESGGQQRMKDNSDAPSRSFLKVEEAYRILGKKPSAGETVADLGAAPGGWAFSAAFHGAHVLAVDNGPLKAGALNNPNIEHCCSDAFLFTPERGHRFDWLYCDMVEDPWRVLKLIRRWAQNSWCRNFIVNFKTGHASPLDVLTAVRDTRDGLAPYCSKLSVHDLFHDRDEITAAGCLDS